MTPTVDPDDFADYQNRCARKFKYSTRAHAKQALKRMRGQGLDTSLIHPLSVYQCGPPVNGEDARRFSHWHVGHRPAPKD